MYRKKPEQNRFGYGAISFVALAGLAYVGLNMAEGWHKYAESTRRLEASHAKLATLEVQYEDLVKTKAHASSPTGMEMQVRSKFDVMKPDEHVVFIIEEEKLPPPIIEEKGSVKKFFNTFKDFFN